MTLPFRRKPMSPAPPAKVRRGFFVEADHFVDANHMVAAYAPWAWRGPGASSCRGRGRIAVGGMRGWRIDPWGVRCMLGQYRPGHVGYDSSHVGT
jgi:hypothetical protein